MFWFRYLNADALRLGTLTLNARQAYSLFYDKGKELFTVTLENNDSTKLNDSNAVENLLATSRSLLTKKTINGCTVAKLKEACKDIEVEPTKIGPVGNPIEISGISPMASGGTPPIPKSFPIGLKLLDENLRTPYLIADPINAQYYDAVKTAMSYLGTRHDPKTRNFVVCESASTPTCLLTLSANRGAFKGVKQIYLVLNWKQLKTVSLRGTVDVALIAQVITHEYAHYKFSNAVKQTDKIKFRQILAGRGVHPDIFSHPGYSNPWYDEAWAVLCEYMVHGHSARGLACTDGWEIAAKYFDNNFLKGGIPSGEKMVEIS